MSPACRSRAFPGWVSSSATAYRPHRWSCGRRLVVLSMLTIAGCAASLFGFAPRAGAAALTTPTWSTSTTTAGATGTSYRYAFTVVTASALSSVTMTVPSGTAGTPAVGTVSPGSLAGGSVALAGTTLTYSFTSTPVSPATAVSIQITGLTNATAGSYTSVITTHNGASGIDTGTTGAVTLTAAALGNPAWSASSTAVGATGVSYTYTFKTATFSLALTSVTMTVPPGTAGTPTVGTVSPGGVAGGSVTLSGTTLTYSFVGALVGSGTAVSIQINGLTNTATAGSYTSEIVTETLGSPVDSGVTPVVSFTGPLTLTSPASLSWAATLTGNDQTAVVTVTADQQLTVNDATASSAGWHITVSATTFTNGTHTLPDTGTFVITGSISSAAANTAPSSSCATSCTPPVDRTIYPVAVTTASTSPPAATIYDAAAGGGSGAITLGGHGAADPVGWWVSVPANARAGAYTSTVTLAVVSGP
jgi:hypothetical protein